MDPDLRYFGTRNTSTLVKEFQLKPNVTELPIQLSINFVTGELSKLPPVPIFFDSGVLGTFPIACDGVEVKLFPPGAVPDTDGDGANDEGILLAGHCGQVVRLFPGGILFDVTQRTLDRIFDVVDLTVPFAPIPDSRPRRRTSHPSSPSCS